jgi:hypothetical protein
MDRNIFQKQGFSARPIPYVRKMPILAAFLFMFILISAYQAHGYVPEGPNVLDLMVKALSGASTLRVQQLVVIEDRALSEQPLDLKEIATYLFPDRFRSDAWYQNTHRILVVSGEQALSVIDDRINTENESRFDLYKDLLLYHSRKLLLKTLLKDQVDVGLTSLGRFDNRIAIVIGAQYPDEMVSQVWVDKDRFLPLRWISYGSGGVSAAGAKDRLEFVYRNWQKWNDIWWPSQIESYHNQQLVRQMRIQKVIANVPVPEQLVTIAHLKTVYPRIEAAPQESKPKNDVEEVQKTIDEFKKKFEN